MQNSSVSTVRCDGHRGCVADIAMLAKDIPLFPVDRWCNLTDLTKARAACRHRIGWAAIFLKAYGKVVQETPELRSWFLPGLWPRIATTNQIVATLAINRMENDTEQLCWARLHQPETLPLVEIQRFIDQCCSKPSQELFKRQRELEMLPGFLRRAVLRWNLGSASRKRSSRIGTFSLSTLAGFGSSNHFHPTLCTTSISYRPIEADGRCLVTLIADHRVIDGAVVARSLAALEKFLTQDLVHELRSQTDSQAPDVTPSNAA
ncbi:MAG: hypothetical protein P8J43_00365 [Pirellulales bacterium]|nr:hypothetical protein [Pirellulales bacterium]